jgi:hypothetical protein
MQAEVTFYNEASSGLQEYGLCSSFDATKQKQATFMTSSERIYEKF